MPGERPIEDSGEVPHLLKSPRAAIEPEPAPAPPSRRKSRGPLFVVVNALFSLTFIAMLTAAVAVYWGKAQFGSPGPLGEDRVVIIPKGQGLQDIASLLKRENVIDHSWLFIAAVWATKAQGRLKAGEFMFPKTASMARVLETIVEGRSILHQVTIPEGLTSAQVVERLAEDPILVGDVRAIPPEGSILPETYKYPRGTTREELIERMQQAQRRVLEEVWNRRTPGLPVQSPEELVILASIVEKETGRADERTRVAAVFINRLRKSMKLQSDPTIIYGLVRGKGSLDRPILKSDIERVTPYNTYVIGGLPPTPIANPGRDALEAVANPSRTDDLYFVADGTGGHVFARTYEEHQRNVARWREVERKQREVEAKGGASEAEPAAAPGHRSPNPASGSTPAVPRRS